ncbi:DUF262 domain-containing protein [Brevundimonas basaltis]|uniref:GmrSD restriction endonucleases N-terminal domain-containing protein n=1 Tax=Brevundimonas basaltis TaxID=472166 RepID=A0A7W8MH65_9CAUL|nr:DUF262 domain-containing protein [Brevundimonas basaltis]MBB5292364.1 hypothetical protein [Brevundimonas basaltis]
MKLKPWEPDLQSLVARMSSGAVDLQPEFQRQEVWSSPKKKRLVDTILRGWSIPPIHLVETAGSRFEVLDGQQRLVSIRDFFEDKFSIDGNITPEDPYVRSLHRKVYSKLDIDVVRSINNYSLRCFIIFDYQPEEPSELFYRLNQPTMLTAGEQRNALYGPARAQLKELVNYFVSSGNTSSSLGFSNTRLAYDDIIARLLFFLENGSFAIKGTESRISERFRSRHGFPDDVVQRAWRTIEHFSGAMRQSPHYRLNKASLISWLLFFSRFEESDPHPGIVSAFSAARNGQYTAHYITEAAAVFEDRASLRVTDVSSVVLRDIVLWYIYCFALNEVPPAPVEPSLLRSLEDAVSQRDDVTFEHAALQVFDLEHWGGLL